MKLLICALLLVAVAATGAFAEEEVKVEDGVLVLTNSNFQEVIKKHPFLLVEFYAPWCGHCKALAPEYAKAAQHLEEQKSEIKLAKVDATVESELAEEYQVRGYPTLKFFRNGVPVDYSGGRQSDDIISWVTKKTGPPAKELNTVEEAEELLKDDKIVVVGFFKNQDSDEAKAFIAVANALDSFEFAISSNDEVVAKYEVKDGSVVLFKPFDDKKSVLEGEANVDNIKKFVQVQSLPLIVEFNHESAAKIFGGSIKSHLLFFVSKEAGHIEKYVDPLKEIAKEYREDILFVTISSDEEEHQRIFEFFGMAKDEVPTIRLIRLEEDMAKYKPESNDLSASTIKSFLQKFMDGKLKQHLLSQELPEDWDKNPVKVLVATNFDDIAFDKSKDVLVEFYAPWCGHCKQLVPIYDQLGEKFKDNENIVVAKIDATANELEHTKISSFPTIKLYRKGDNKVIDYNLDRTFDDFVKFLEAGGDVSQGGESEEEVTEKPEEHPKDEL
ncbi:PREDICTED: protein disulfide-isomerase [Rhagoletis zephyria]|uniref:protein disulfide-isomerase n=1 Tax=Rhagoletis zephyria TaxID=28612 RepID=UPI0008116669|nr:PREDICTED: protein disulfide-isomerase [Rhagoletis zephyria]